jgi:serine kinase of HPr protein (carbohydrate metabolism regulator)
MKINKPTIDKYIKLIVNKVAYNRRVNQLIKPFKVELISKHFDRKNFAQLQLDGNIGEVKIQKVTRPYVDLEKLLANSKDAKKYVTYKTSYRLTAKQFEAELNAEAQADAA